MLVIAMAFAIVGVGTATTCPTINALSRANLLITSPSQIGTTDSIVYLEGYNSQKSVLLMNMTNAQGPPSGVSPQHWTVVHSTGGVQYYSRTNLIFTAGTSLLVGREGLSGFADGAATVALFLKIVGMTSSENGDTLYVADADDTQKIRVVDVETKFVSSLGVTGPIAISDIKSIARNGAYLFFVDGRQINKISITGGGITNVVGAAGGAGTVSSDGAAAIATFGGPITGFAFTSPSTVGMPAGNGIVISEDSAVPRLRWVPLDGSGETQTLMVAGTNGTTVGESSFTTALLSENPHITSMESVFVVGSTVFIVADAYSSSDAQSTTGVAVLRITAPVCASAPPPPPPPPPPSPTPVACPLWTVAPSLGMALNQSTVDGSGDIARITEIVAWTEVPTGPHAALYVLDVVNANTNKLRFVNAETNSITTQTNFTDSKWLTLTASSTDLFTSTDSRIYKAPLSALASGHSGVFAGGAAQSPGVDSQTATSVRFGKITGMVYLGGMLYVLDADAASSGVGRIRVVNATTGATTSYAQTMNDIGAASRLTADSLVFRSRHQIGVFTPNDPANKLVFVAGFTGTMSPGDESANGIGETLKLGEISSLVPSFMPKAPHTFNGILALDTAAGHAVIRFIPLESPNSPQVNISQTFWAPFGPGEANGNVTVAEFAVARQLMPRIVAGSPSGYLFNSNNGLLRTVTLPSCSPPVSGPSPCHAGHKHPSSTSESCLACGKNTYRPATNTDNTCSPCAPGTGTVVGVTTAPDAGHCKNLTQTVQLPSGTTPEARAVERSAFLKSGPGNGVFANRVTVNTSQIVLLAVDIENAPQSKTGPVRTAVAYVDMQPSGLTFPDGVVLKIQLPAGSVHTDFTINFFDTVADAWVPVTTYLCDAAFPTTVCATVYHFTGFGALLGVPGATESTGKTGVPPAIIAGIVAEIVLFLLAAVLITKFSKTGIPVGTQDDMSNRGSRDWQSLLHA